MNLSIRVPIPEAAHRMGCSQQFLREALKADKYEWGRAVLHKSRWIYYIHRAAFEKWLEGTE